MAASTATKAHPEPAADYLIVGAGSAGCVVANRLTAGGRHRVILLEAGPSDRRPSIQVPIGYGVNYNNPAVNWMFESAPIPGFDGRTNYFPRGKILGGSSSINAMVYSRGQAGDFDAWAAHGNPGWSWADLLPLYRRMEDHALGASPWHGAGGPVHVTEISRFAHPTCKAFFDGAAELGLAFNPDLNGATQEGVGHYQITTRNGLRLSASRAYLWPARRRENLTIVTGAMVHRILFAGTRAIGVEYQWQGETKRIFAGREVILAAGSIGSPQLLQLSGVGPAAALAGLGIGLTHDLPAVGANLQDHLCYDHIYRCRQPTLNQELGPWSGKILAGLRYLLTRGGPLSLSVNQGGGYFRSGPEVERPDIQLYYSPLTYEHSKKVGRKRRLMNPDAFPGAIVSVSPCRPSSRGRLRLASADPAAAPLIEPNYLSTNDDIETLLRGARFLRRLSRTKAMQGLIEAEMKPGPGATSDADLVADIRASSYSVFHPVSTCRMGPSPREDVVDAKLRVHGLDGLRVVDASIFPYVTSGNTNAPAMLVGEKGADLILESLG